MNCQECRKNLHPYLDDELGVEKNLTILEHLNACAACRGLFEGEESCWNHVRERARGDGAPSTLLGSVSDTIQGYERRVFWRRLVTLAAPLAAAAVLAVVLATRGDPAHGPGGTHGHEHGPGIGYALADHRQFRQGVMIAKDFIDLENQRYKKLRGADLETFFLEHFGPDAHVPPGFLVGESWGVPRKVSFAGTPVSTLMLDVQDQDVDVYRLTRKQAALANLHVVEDGITRGLRIERCRKCRVVAVTRGDDVFILVTRGGDVDPLVAIMRQTF